MSISKKIKNYLTEDNMVTSKDEGHTHTFEVDNKGNGETSVDNGHSHKIIKWKVQPAGKNNHIHKIRIKI